MITMDERENITPPEIPSAPAPAADEMTMEELLAEAEREKSLVGTAVTARVVDIGASGVLVDIGLKSEGVIPLAEFHALPAPPKPGDTFPVVIKSPSGPDGHTLVSWSEARTRAAWPRILEAKTAGTPVEGRVIRAVKGGLVVDVGLEAFLPASQADRRAVQNLNGWVGKTLTLLVLETDQKKGNVVVSRRSVLEREARAKREEMLKTLAAGQVLQGTVTGLTNFGAFVDVGGVEGLVRLPDISWRRIGKPSDELKVGQTVEVKVLKFDPAAQKLSLGRKQCLPHPWDGIEARFPAGKIIEGKVTHVTDFGAFVELAPGIEGLIHKSEFSWDERAAKPSELAAPGRTVSVWVLTVNRAEERISLSLKRAGENPWQDVAVKFPVGSKVKGVVTRLAEFGAFVALGGGIEGLLRVEDLSWARRIPHPKDVLSVGQELELKVLEVNSKAEKLALSLKQMSPDPYAAFQVGATVEGPVTRLTERGAFVMIAPEIEAFLPAGEISSEHRGEDPSERRREGSPERRREEVSELLKVGDVVTASVIRVEKKPRRIEISVRKHDRKEERRLLKQYRDSGEGVSLADVTGWGRPEETADKPGDATPP